MRRDLNAWLFAYGTRSRYLRALLVPGALLFTLFACSSGDAGTSAEADRGGGDGGLSFADSCVGGNCAACPNCCGPERCAEGYACAPELKCRRSCTGESGCEAGEHCCGGLCYRESCVTTLAGSGERGAPGGPADSVFVNGVHGMAVDAAGNLLFTQWPSGGLYLVNASSEPLGGVKSGHVGPVIGARNGCRAGSTASAEIGLVTGIAIDSSGTVFLADYGCSVIWKVAPDFSRMWVLAGAPGQQGDDDGTGEAARFRRPRGIALGPDGALYVSDLEAHLVRRVSRSGEVTTVAGAAGVSGLVDGTAAESRFASPVGVASDEQGRLFVADWATGALRLLSGVGSDSPTVGTVVSSVAREGACGRVGWARPNEQAGPAGNPGHTTIAMQDGTRPIVPFWDNGIWRLDPPTEAGGAWTYRNLLDQGGLIAVAARDGRLWTGGWVHRGAAGVIGERNMVRQYDLNNLGRGPLRSAGVQGRLGVRDGAGSGATFSLSWCGSPSLAVDGSGNTWVADACADRVRKIAADGTVESFGSGVHGTIVEVGEAKSKTVVAEGGSAADAKFCVPTAIGVVGTDVFVVNRGCGAEVMRIDSTTNQVEVRKSICVAGQPACALPRPGSTVVADGSGNLYIATDIAPGIGDPPGTSGAEALRFGSCHDGMALLVRVPDLGKGDPAYFAGSPNNPADPANRQKCVDGPFKTGQFGGGPNALALGPDGTLYVADGSCGVRKVDGGGVISTVAAEVDAVGLTFETRSGRLIVSSPDDTLRAVDPATGSVSPLAGKPFSYDAHFQDGLPSQALFWSPGALGADPQGNIYILDRNNDRVRVLFPRPN